MSVFPAKSQVLSNRPVALGEGEHNTAENTDTVTIAAPEQQQQSIQPLAQEEPFSGNLTQPTKQEQTQDQAPEPKENISEGQASSPEQSQMPSPSTPTPQSPEKVLEDLENEENNIAHKISPQPESSDTSHNDPAHVSAFKQNYGDIDHATNDLLLPKKNVQAAQDRFISELEQDTKSVGIKLVKQEPFFSSPLDNSAGASILLLFRDIPLVKVHFHAKGKDLQDIHAKRSGAYTAEAYPVETTFSPRLARELAYDLNLDPEQDERGIQALVRPFKHIAEAQPYRFVFDEEGQINREESQEDRLKHHFVMMASQLVFAAGQLGISKREPTFVNPEDNSDYFE